MQPRILCGLALLLAAACAAHGPPLDRAQLAVLASAAPPPAGAHVPLPPARLERLIAEGRWQIRASEDAGAGVTGAKRIRVHLPEAGATLDFKWKASPREDADGWNNAPRKEIAAYEIQKWFLAPEAYVVPPVGVRCIPLDAYRAIDPDPEPNLDGARCVLGMAALWLENVETPDELYTRERFLRDGVYARHLAHLNLLTYLIAHRDARRGNLLVSTDDANRRVFSVDNGIAFDGLVFNFFQRHWNVLRVPALPRRAIERLRAVGPAQLRELAVLAELERDAQDVLRAVAPRPPIDPERGSRREDVRLQLGLTTREIAGVERRLARLLRDVDEGSIPLF